MNQNIIQINAQLSAAQQTIDKLNVKYDAIDERLIENDAKIRMIRELIESTTDANILRRLNRDLKEAEANGRSLRKDKTILLREKDSLLRDKDIFQSQKELLIKKESALIQETKPDRIRIPYDVPFSKEPANAVTGSDECPHLVGLAPIIEEAVGIILEHLPKKLSTGYRVPPLAFTSLARGGKTTALRLLFDALKDATLDGKPVHPIYISFNGNQDFYRQEGESQIEAIVRTIATTFVDVPKGGLNKLFCTAPDLLAFLNKKYGDEPVVLLIDELNELSRPLDIDAGAFLRREFLDRSNRYLVFTSHRFMRLDVTSTLGKVHSPQSPRDMLNIGLPITTNLPELRAMDPSCAALNKAEVALYGGIPSLIYVAKKQYISIVDRVEDSRIWNDSKFTNNLQQTLELLVKSLLDGQRSSNSSIDPLYEFSMSRRDSKVLWPLSYVKVILMKLPKLPATEAIVQTIDDLEVYAKKSESGLDWECVITIGVMLRCVDSLLRGSTVPFKLANASQVFDVKYISMLDDVKTLDDAKSCIEMELADAPCGTLTLFVPTYHSFPLFDQFLAIRTASTTQEKEMKIESKIVGLQCKEGKGIPNQSCPDWITCGFLLRGQAPSTSYKSRDSKWHYYSKSDTLSMLGFSLGSLYPGD